MLALAPITLVHLAALAESHETFLSQTGWSAAEGSLLPSEFIAEFLPRAQSAAPWLGLWALADSTVVGSGMFKSAPQEGSVEIGYGVAPSAEGQGVATTIAGALVEFAFQHGAREVIAHTLPDGYASQRVLAKTGFEPVGMVEDPEDGLVLRFRRSPSG